MKKTRYALCAGLLLLAFTAGSWGSDVEQRLKAVYLGRFAEYVQFPADHRTRSEFVIAVLGPDPFGGQLQAFYHNRQIQQKPVRILHASRLEDLLPCDLLYINVPTHLAREAALEFAHQHQALTIAEARGFAELGGIIQIGFVEQKARITINHAAAMNNGLQIRAPLLSIATVLQGEQP